MTATPAPRQRLASRPSPRTPVPHPSSEAARLRRLLEAQALITSTLPLREVLTRIVHLACELTGARFGALGVVDADDRLELLVQVGDEPSDIGAAVTDPTVAVSGETTMCFLGVPVVVGGATGGEIYLADCVAGRFTAADEELVNALADVAGIVVGNARRADDARRHHEWADAAHEITRALLAEADVDMVLEVISRALTLGEADMGMLALPGKDGVLRATVVVGTGADRYQDWVFEPALSPLARLLAQGQSVLRADLVGITSPKFDNAENFGPIMSAPLVDARGVRGSVLLIRTADRPAFTAADLAHLTMFADQVALALDMDDARTDAEWLHVLEVRHRIAQDLHDNVIQRLFATGMGLHSIDPALLPGTLGQRLTRYISELDETIDEVRERVFGLQSGSATDRRAESRFPRVRTPQASTMRPAPRPGCGAARRPRPVAPVHADT